MEKKKVHKAWKTIAIILICLELIQISLGIYSSITYDKFLKENEELELEFDKIIEHLIDEGLRLCSNECFLDYDYDLLYNIYDELVCVCYDEEYNIIKSTYFGE